MTRYINVDWFKLICSDWCYKRLNTGVEDLSLEQTQDRMGWRIFIQGAMPTKWYEHQQHYVTTTEKTSNGQRWLAQLITNLWGIAWDSWDHSTNNEAHHQNKYWAGTSSTADHC